MIIINTYRIIAESKRKQRILSLVAVSEQTVSTNQPYYQNKSHAKHKTYFFPFEKILMLNFTINIINKERKKENEVSLHSMFIKKICNIVCQQTLRNVCNQHALVLLIE